MTDNELKAMAAAKLATHGVKIAHNAPFRTLAHAIGVLVGSTVPWNQGLADYVRAWAVPPKAPMYVRPWKDLAITPHPRQAEIDAIPRPISMGWVGNGGESGMGRGR